MHPFVRPTADLPLAQPARRRAGFTVIELLIVMVIVGLLVAFALPAYSRFVANQRVKTASTSLYFTMLQARSESLKRGVDVTIKMATGGWANGWSTPDPANTTNNIQSQIPFTAVTITPNPSTQTTVVYQSSGRISSTTAPQFLFTATAWSGAVYCVSTDPSGRPYSVQLSSGQTTC